MPEFKAFALNGNFEEIAQELHELPDIKEREESKKRMWECYKQSLTIPKR
jgi:hypothetical protein